jgi:hypothetical protein
MEILFVLLALLALWIFIRHDQSRIKNGKTEPLSRDTMKKGFVPGASVPWKGQAGLSLLFFIGAVNATLSPTLPPFSGRWSFLQSALYAVLGTYGAAALWGALSILFALLAYGKYNATLAKHSA